MVAANLVVNVIFLSLYFPKIIPAEVSLAVAMVQYCLGYFALGFIFQTLRDRKNPFAEIIIASIILSLGCGSLYCALFKRDETSFVLNPNNTILEKTFSIYYAALQVPTPGENGAPTPESAPARFVMLTQSLTHYYLGMTFIAKAIQFFKSKNNAAF